MLGYLLLLLLFSLFFSVSFYFGFREWRRPWDAAPLPIDVEYVRVENYFGRSFRAKMQQWLAEAQPNGIAAGLLPSGVLLKTSGGEHLLTLPGGRLERRGEQVELIYCEGDLTLAGGSTFRREIYCRGRCETEATVQLQSIAADGDVILGLQNEVARWVDAQGKVRLRSGTVVGSRVSSSTSIELERQVRAQSLYAPVVCTADCALMNDPVASLRREAAPPIPNGQAGTPPAVPPYLAGVRCLQLSPRTWLVQDDLDLPAGCRVESNLIVKGTLRAGSDCHFAGDLKASCIQLGSRNRVGGNLVSDGSIEVGEGSFIARNVAAGTHIRFSAGVRVGQLSLPAVVSAGSEVSLEQNVAIYGKVAAGRWIQTL